MSHSRAKIFFKKIKNFLKNWHSLLDSASKHGYNSAC